jgi:hypothetical protein
LNNNALKTIVAMAFALDGTKGETVIESRGTAHRINFKVDQVRAGAEGRPHPRPVFHRERHQDHGAMKRVSEIAACSSLARVSVRQKNRTAPMKEAARVMIGSGPSDDRHHTKDPTPDESDRHD